MLKQSNSVYSASQLLYNKIMGNLLTNKNHKSLSNAYNPSMEGWAMVERKTQYNIWRNPISQEEIQQYRFMVNDQEEFQKQKSIFQARYLNENLVASKFFIDDSEKQFCSEYFKGNIFIERIPFRIFEVQSIGFPEIFHVYSQCLKGFAELYDHIGFFSISQQMIGINTDGVVKVWFNKDFGKSISQPVYVQGTQRQMIVKLVKILSFRTQPRLPINLADLLLKNNPSNFRDAHITLQSLSTRLNTDIPDYLPSVFGRMRKMIKGQSRLSSQIYSGSQIIPASYRQVSKPNLYKQSMATDSVLSFKQTSMKGDNKYNFKTMPIDYNSHHSMISAFPQLSRISRISLPKQRKVQFVPLNALSPPSRQSKTSAKPINPSLFRSNKQQTTKLFVSPNGFNPSQAKNTQLYYSGAAQKIPAESIKHLPIIRQNIQHEISKTSSNQKSFNYHVSDHNRLVQKYTNKLKNNDQTSIYTVGNPESFELNYSSSKINPLDQSHYPAIQNLQLNGESNISKFSILKKSQYQQSQVSGKSHIPLASQYNQSVRISQYTINSNNNYRIGQDINQIHRTKHNNFMDRTNPIVSSSKTGIVYKQTNLTEPSLISDNSFQLQNDHVNSDQKSANKKISMAAYSRNFSNNKLGVIQQNYSTQMDPQLLNDLNSYRRKKFVPPIM